MGLPQNLWIRLAGIHHGGIRLRPDLSESRGYGGTGGNTKKRLPEITPSAKTPRGGEAETHLLFVLSYRTIVWYKRTHEHIGAIVLLKGASGGVPLAL